MSLTAWCCQGQYNLLKKMHLKMLSETWCPFCPDLNVLKWKSRHFNAPNWYPWVIQSPTINFKHKPYRSPWRRHPPFYNFRKTHLGGTPSVIEQPHQYSGKSSHMLPWEPLLELLCRCPTFKLSHCNSFEDQAPVDEIYGCPIFKRVAESWLHGRVPVEIPKSWNWFVKMLPQYMRRAPQG